MSARLDKEQIMGTRLSRVQAELSFSSSTKKTKQKTDAQCLRYLRDRKNKSHT